MIEPVAWIGQDAFAALLGGETICQTMTPSQAMYDDVPLTVIPPGYAIVPVEQVKDAERYRELRQRMRRINQERAMATNRTAPPIKYIARVWSFETPDLESNTLDETIDKAMLTAAAKGE